MTTENINDATVYATTTNVRMVQLARIAESRIKELEHIVIEQDGDLADLRELLARCHARLRYDGYTGPLMDGVAVALTDGRGKELLQRLEVSEARVRELERGKELCTTTCEWHDGPCLTHRDHNEDCDGNCGDPC